MRELRNCTLNITFLVNHLGVQPSLTMSSQLPKRKRKSHQEKESEIVIKSLRRRLAWCNRNGQQFNEPEQYSIFPRALAVANCMPHKSAKSSWTDKLKSRIPAVFSHTIQREFIPQVVIIDAIFVLNTKPLRSIKTISQYSKLRLFSRYIQNIFNVVCLIEVHVIFDNPNRVKIL